MPQEQSLQPSPVPANGQRQQAFDIEREIERLIALKHPNPHSLLGPHRTASGFVVRAYRPGATRVLLTAPGMPPRPMEQRRETGLFELLVEQWLEVPRYGFEIEYPQNKIAVERDPYSFAPTLGQPDLRLFGEGKHLEAYKKLGAHVLTIDGARGTAFAVWAPNARGVSVVGDFNAWDGRLHPMRRLGCSGVWELFIPAVGEGALYKFEIQTADDTVALKTDPYAAAMEKPPATASIVYRSTYSFRDSAWMDARAAQDVMRAPISIYEVHFGSWRRCGEHGQRPLSYREMAQALGDYVADLGFTHVEFLPIMEHPYEPSWGYQVSGYFAPTARYGSPDDFRYLVDCLHQRGVGVILDWVPGHFPKDAFCLGWFDGTALYEHLDPRKGQHPQWGTYIFNFGRHEVNSFLLSSAQNWLGEYHADGLRVDAVASMLYLDYARGEGQWIPNQYGGRENLEAIAFLRTLNRQVYARNPGIMMIAEESTAWPGVSHPTYTGGLGFGLKWDMGWMHDTLEYFAKDPVYRRYHHRNLTFGFLYAWNENFVLPLSHDEVVYGKRSLLAKMPGGRAQQFANLRSLFGYMWARPGKKLLFMGGEFGQWREWNYNESLDWHLLEEPDHRGLKSLVRDLNRIYRAEPALWEAELEPAGFEWIQPDDADSNVIAFMRVAPRARRRVVCACNFSGAKREQYRIGVPEAGRYQEILNTDSSVYGGGNAGNRGAVEAEPVPCHGRPYSISVTLPPFSVLWFAVPEPTEGTAPTRKVQ
jgi:1,4-alpha-glucan branching enzyme